MSSRGSRSSKKEARGGQSGAAGQSALADTKDGTGYTKSWTTKSREIAGKATTLIFGASGANAEVEGYESKTKYMRSRWDTPDTHEAILCLTIVALLIIGACAHRHQNGQSNG